MNIDSHLSKLKTFIESEDFKGYDPYDGLTSPILNALSQHSKFLRLACIQFVKRMPLNLRPLLLIKKDYNPKGLGLFLWGYTKLYAIDQKDAHLTMINHLLSLLDRLKSQGSSGNGWGYNFDWQSRALFVPKYTPTIVNSAFIGHALLDTYLITGKDTALKMAVPIKDFIIKDLNKKRENNSLCFSYTPLDHTAVHNANLLGASFLIRLRRFVNDEQLEDIALSSLEYSMKYQCDDGSWYYAETEFQQWIDSYHTGFNLQSIHYFLEEGLVPEYADRFQKGVRFYKENLFLKDGTPKFYHNRIYPIDIHAPSQAIVFFSRLGKEYQSFTDKLMAWLVNHMVHEKGYFYYQIKKQYVNKIPYIRWGQAWAFHALTEYALSASKRANNGNDDLNPNDADKGKTI